MKERFKYRHIGIVWCCQCKSELFVPYNDIEGLKRLIAKDDLICPYCKTSNKEHVKKIIEKIERRNQK